MLHNPQVNQVEEEVNQEVPSYENSIVQRFSKLTTRPGAKCSIDDSFQTRSSDASCYSLSSEHTSHTSQTSIASSMSSPASLAQQQQNHNWQATKSSVRERNAVMFNNDLMADVHFMVGGNSSPLRIPAHKYVLATGSSVFFAMFYGGLADTSKDINIPDVEPAAFLNLLK